MARPRPLVRAAVDGGIGMRRCEFDRCGAGCRRFGGGLPRGVGVLFGSCGSAHNRQASGVQGRGLDCLSVCTLRAW
jgi:hypothetical protein